MFRLGWAFHLCFFSCSAGCCMGCLCSPSMSRCRPRCAFDGQRSPPFMAPQGSALLCPALQAPSQTGPPSRACAPSLCPTISWTGRCRRLCRPRCRSSLRAGTACKVRGFGHRWPAGQGGGEREHNAWLRWKKERRGRCTPLAHTKHKPQLCPPAQAPSRLHGPPGS